MFAYIIGVIIGLVIWFFMNRASVRANRQVELLESIEKHLSSISGRESIDSKTPESSSAKSADVMLEEARKNAGL